MRGTHSKVHTGGASPVMHVVATGDKCPGCKSCQHGMSAHTSEKWCGGVRTVTRDKATANGFTLVLSSDS